MSSDILVACAVCFGTADGPMLDAAQVGVLVMVGITCVMLGAFGAFFVRMARRSPAADASADLGVGRE
jgi:hypothetical protein